MLRTTFGPKKDKVIGSRENYIIRSLMLVVFTKYYSGDPMEKNELGGAGNTYV